MVSSFRILPPPQFYWEPHQIKVKLIQSEGHQESLWKNQYKWFSYSFQKLPLIFCAGVMCRRLGGWMMGSLQDVNTDCLVTLHHLYHSSDLCFSESIICHTNYAYFTKLHIKYLVIVLWIHKTQDLNLSLRVPASYWTVNIWFLRTIKSICGFCAPSSNCLENVKHAWGFHRLSSTAVWQQSLQAVWGSFVLMPA